RIADGQSRIFMFRLRCGAATQPPDWMEPQGNPMPQIRDKKQLKSYAAPQLKLYGSVQALTASGTGPTNESQIMDVNSTHAVTKCNTGNTSWIGYMDWKHCF